MPDFLWTQEQQDLQRSLREFAESELNNDLQQRDSAGQFNARGWQRCAEQGILGLPLAAEYGGGGKDALTTAFALEGFGHGCRDNGLNFAIGAHLWGCAQSIQTFGSESQKQRYLPRLSSGECMGALAVSEPGAGSDALGVNTTATRDGDHYRLNGHKIYITNGPLAELVLVLAVVQAELGSLGLAVFALERGCDGAVFSEPVQKMGLRTAAMGEITLTDCAVPAANLLGQEGAGLAVFSHAMLWERSLILAPALGSQQRQLESCVAYARERKQFGKPIGDFQLVSSRVVDMRMRLETSRFYLYKAAWLLDRTKPAYEFSAMAKLAISEAWIASCQDAMQIHGGRGYLVEAGIERDLRDAFASRLYSGTSELQRQMIAQWQGL